MKSKSENLWSNSLLEGGVQSTTIIFKIEKTTVIIIKFESITIHYTN